MIYRREIDGLRAIAVVPVILFHAGLTLFSGGYIGVDVFFVISGYLITTILIGELEQDNFSIVRFYERRARRILPALFLVMLCCIPFAWMWMAPSELKDFSQSAVAVVFFASNILFWREEGYFAPAAELKPLLHTWSLAVEEQYYLLFPIFLLLTWRFGRNRVFWSICLIAVISLAASEWGWRNKPSANFYLAPTRAWELLAGSMCAFWLSNREQPANNWLSLSGLALIVFAIYYYDDVTPFPSVYALAPVLGTALIIVFGGTGTWTAKLLSMQGFVGIGLISYSAYLWHQPLFAFARIRSILEPSPYLMAALAVLSLVLAYLSWRYVEKPFRNGQASILPTRRAVFATSAFAAAAFVAGGLVGHLTEGFPLRKTPSGETFDNAFKSDRVRANYGLHKDCEGEFTLSKNCRTSEKFETILWGDSFAMHLAGAVKNSPTKIEFIQMTKSQCAPIIDIAVIGSITPWEDCVLFNDKVLKYIESNNNIKTIIMSSIFNIVDESSAIYERNGNLYDGDNEPFVEKKIVETISNLNSLGKNVVLVSPPPNNTSDLGQCLLKANALNLDMERCDFYTGENSSDGNGDIINFLNNISGKHKFKFISLDRYICRFGRCKANFNGVFIYRDSGHLSIEGSEMLGKRYDFAGAIAATLNNDQSR